MQNNIEYLTASQHIGVKNNISLAGHGKQNKSFTGHCKNTMFLAGLYKSQFLKSHNMNNEFLIKQHETEIKNIGIY